MTTTTVGCQRGHTKHAKHWVHITLGGPTGFADYTPIPARLARSFDMLVYDRDPEPGPLCPANDAVSEMLDIHGVWEPQGTVLALTVCESATERQMVVDMGAQVGWYSLLAASCGLTVLAVDADAESLAMLDASAVLNGWGARVSGLAGCQRDHIETMLLVVGPDTDVWGNGPEIRFLKIDIEGAEADAVRIVRPAIAAGNVDHIQMECSPIFGPGYPELVEQIIGAGYRAFTMPPKGYPPVDLSDPETALAPYRLDLLPRTLRMGRVANCGQMDVWFQREGASW